MGKKKFKLLVHGPKMVGPSYPRLGQLLTSMVLMSTGPTGLILNFQYGFVVTY